MKKILNENEIDASGVTQGSGEKSRNYKLLWVIPLVILITAIIIALIIG